MTVKKAPMYPAYQKLFEIEKALEAIDIKEGSKKEENGEVPKKLLMPSEIIVKHKTIDIELQQVLKHQPKNASIVLTMTYPIFSSDDGNSDKDENINELLPTLIYVHGGGWVGGDYEIYEKFMKDIAVKAKSNITFINYHIAPETKFPVPVEEVYSSILWISQHTKELKINKNKLIIGGDSAGGNLTAATVLLLKQRGYEQLLSGQILIYPGVARERDEFESYHLYGDGDYPYNREEMKYHHLSYLGEGFEHREHFSYDDLRRAPLLASPSTDLKNLPRTLLITAECDIVRDEGESYARKLSQAGVQTNAIRLLGAPHSLITQHLETPQYLQTIHSISYFLNEY